MSTNPFDELKNKRLEKERKLQELQEEEARKTTALGQAFDANKKIVTTVLTQLQESLYPNKKVKEFREGYYWAIVQEPRTTKELDIFVSIYLRFSESAAKYYFNCNTYGYVINHSRWFDDGHYIEESISPVIAHSQDCEISSESLTRCLLSLHPSDR
jgi:hypothetical protein